MKRLKYLGVILSRDLSWNSHINYVSTKASRKLGFIKMNATAEPFGLHIISSINHGIRQCRVGPTLSQGQGFTGENPEKDSMLDYYSTYDQKTSVTVVLQ